MTKLEVLNREMLDLEHDGHILEDEYSTYKALLEAVEALQAASEIIEESVAPRCMYGAEVTDDRHPWGKEVLQVRAALEKFK